MPDINADQGGVTWDFNDTMSGTNDRDIWYDRNGDDVYYAGDGNDYIKTGAGSDTLYGEGGNDDFDEGYLSQYGSEIFYGGAGNDTFRLNAGRDTVLPGTGNDNITSMATTTLETSLDVRGSIGDLSNDTITVHYQNSDYLTITVENSTDTSDLDTLDGQTVSGITLDSIGSTLYLSFPGLNSSDYLFDVEKVGNDYEIQIEPATAGDSITGTANSDELFGKALGDTILGLAGDDILAGIGGLDSLIGDDGNDTMMGGGGEDRFVFSAGDGSDVVFDFAAGSDDIDLTSFTSLTGMSDTLFSVSDGAIGAEVIYNGETIVTLVGVEASAVPAGDFVFAP